jgi:hypothetical protein
LTPAAFAALLPEVTIPRLPFMGAYGLVVRSLSDAEALLRRGDLRPRAIGAALAASFPEELGVGAWLFAENAADFPWQRRA